MEFEKDQTKNTKPHTFVKTITRGNKGKRGFDKKRANKIHMNLCNLKSVKIRAIPSNSFLNLCKSAIKKLANLCHPSDSFKPP